MHEAKVMEKLMELIDRKADEAGAERVEHVSVWIGALAHMSEAHFLEHFVDASRGRRSEGATVSVELSHDLGHPDAAGVRLESIQIADLTEPESGAPS